MAAERSQDHELSSGRTTRQGWGYVALENDANSRQGLGLGAGLTKYLVLRTPVAESRRFFAEALLASRRCSPRAIAAVGLHVDWQWSFLTQAPKWSNHRARNWEFHLNDDFFQDGVQHDNQLFYYRRHTAHGSPHSGACIQGQDAAHTWCRGNHHCGAYIQGKGAAYRAQRVHHTSAYEYSTARNSYAQFMHFMRSFSLRFYTVAAVV